MAYNPNSLAQGYGYVRPEWTVTDGQARAGTVEELTVPSVALDGERHLCVYVPARKPVEEVVYWDSWGSLRSR